MNTDPLSNHVHIRCCIIEVGQFVLSKFTIIVGEFVVIIYTIAIIAIIFVPADTIATIR